MEYESSVPRLEKPATGAYPDPDEYSHHHILLL